MGQFSKSWKDLDISDNFIFCKVMRNKEICKRLLEILLGFKVGDIIYNDSEHVISDFYDYRGIRLDVFVKDSNKVYDIEMQTGNYSDLLLRARYYQSACDINSTPRRTSYNKLKETYIIFICKDDPFGQDLPLYSLEKSFSETDKIPYDDKSHKLFYNCSSYAKAKDPDIRDVLEFIYTLQANSDFTQTLDYSAKEAKLTTSFEDEYMYFVDVLEMEKEEAREIGLAEGIAEGLEKGLEKGLAEGREKGLAEGQTEGILKASIANARNALLKGLDKKTVSEIVNLPMEQIEQIYAELL